MFGEEFARNNGANVVCNYDPKSKEIYWTIPDRQESILNDDGSVDEDAGYIDFLGARMNNKALIESQLNPNNAVEFFPTHGDPSPILNVMHEGDKEADIPGLGEGIKGDVLTITKEVEGDDGEMIEEKTDYKGKEANAIIRKRLNGYDFSNTLNSSGAQNLYGDAVKKNIRKLQEIKEKDVSTLNDTEKRILKTWYGEDMKLDDKDPIVKFRENGSAGFGPYIGDDRGQASQSDIVQLQRDILSNGLILDYEDKFLLKEQEEIKSDIEEETNVDVVESSDSVATEEPPILGDFDSDGKVSPEEQWEIDWENAKIGDEVKGPDGKTYTKS